MSMSDECFTGAQKYPLTALHKPGFITDQYKSRLGLPDDFNSSFHNQNIMNI
jgi:hypothetical protein